MGEHVADRPARQQGGRAGVELLRGAEQQLGRLIDIGHEDQGIHRHAKTLAPAAAGIRFRGGGGVRTVSADASRTTRGGGGIPCLSVRPLFDPVFFDTKG
ncbi:hypothetical protein Ahu01nite_003950 [Winogradskya humida]|uniref:Uncharacterized protein n=1 Tax=Winogradskya humida TaxID=113566 RepID=A0ABQ3ZFD8_9ACTN|nr:hypothetical protein Ahu01nite_003950 [Actinoplanes humidus]